MPTSGEVQVIDLDASAPTIELAFITGTLTRIKRWTGSAWIDVNPGVIYLVKSGDPEPPMNENDLAIRDT